MRTTGAAVFNFSLTDISRKAPTLRQKPLDANQRPTIKIRKNDALSRYTLRQNRLFGKCIKHITSVLPGCTFMRKRGAWRRVFLYSPPPNAGRLSIAFRSCLSRHCRIRSKKTVPALNVALHAPFMRGHLRPMRVPAAQRITYRPYRCMRRSRPVFPGESAPDGGLWRIHSVPRPLCMKRVCLPFRGKAGCGALFVLRPRQAP